MTRNKRPRMLSDSPEPLQGSSEAKHSSGPQKNAYTRAELNVAFHNIAKHLMAYERRLENWEKRLQELEHLSANQQQQMYAHNIGRFYQSDSTASQPVHSGQALASEKSQPIQSYEQPANSAPIHQPIQSYEQLSASANTQPVRPHEQPTSFAAIEQPDQSHEQSSVCTNTQPTRSYEQPIRFAPTYQPDRSYQQSSASVTTQPSQYHGQQSAFAFVNAQSFKHTWPNDLPNSMPTVQAYGCLWDNAFSVPFDTPVDETAMQGRRVESQEVSGNHAHGLQ